MAMGTMFLLRNRRNVNGSAGCLSAEQLQGFIDRPHETYLFVAVAFPDKIVETLAFNILKVAHNPKLNLVGRKFLKDFAGQS